MSTETTPLTYLGTQSRETVALEAAMAQDALRATGPSSDQPVGKLADEAMENETHREASLASRKIGALASLALGKAKDTLQSAADDVRDRATTAVATYTKEDPIRAILIAAGAGALVMVILSMMARSGARTVKRKVQRSRR